jgi:hypothetical protein
MALLGGRRLLRRVGIMGGRILFTVVGARCRVRWVRVLRRARWVRVLRRLRATRSLRSHLILPLVEEVPVLAILLPLVAEVVVGDIRPVVVEAAEAGQRTSRLPGTRSYGPVVVFSRSALCFVVGAGETSKGKRRSFGCAALR